MEIIKEKIAYYKEYIRGIILFNIALLSGITTNLYQVFVKSKPFYSIIFSFVGLVLFIISLITFYFLHIRIENLIKELENEL